MTPFWWGIVVGLVLGAHLGVLVLSLCVLASRRQTPCDDAQDETDLYRARGGRAR